MQAAAPIELPPSHDGSVPGNLRSALREATAAAHARLDAHFGRLDLQQLRDYRRFLIAQAAAVLPLETVLLQSGVQQAFPDWSLRMRSDALRSDIARLGGTLSAFIVPPRLEFDAMLGTMYVLEGSRLGARYLLRQVLQSPDRLVAGTTAYLGHGVVSHGAPGHGVPGHGAGSGLWQSFLAMLEQHGRSLHDPSMAIAGARRAFKLFAAQATRLATGETAPA